MGSFVSRLVLVVVVVVGLTAAVAPPAMAQKADAREVRARELFAVGRYAEALELYGKLYAETTHPTYMRNIGRCYQNMGEPDKAISSFREYLRQARELTPNQRAQVEGYIGEMEDLRRQRQAASPPPPATSPKTTTAPVGEPPPTIVAPSPTVPPTPTGPPPPGPLSGFPSSNGASVSRDEGHPRRLAGMVVGAASVAALAVGGVFGLRAFSKHHASDDNCPKDAMGVEQCKPNGVTLNEEAWTAAHISDAAFGLGLVGAAVTTYLFVSARGGGSATPVKDTQSSGAGASSVRVLPAVGQGGGGLVLGASW